MEMAAPLTLLIILAVTIRAALYRSSLADLITERVEVVSPLTAWKRGKQEFPSFLLILQLNRRYVFRSPLSCLTEVGHVSLDIKIPILRKTFKKQRHCDFCH